MTPPLVSAVIPTKDRAAVCVRAVESVLRQTYPNIECIVIDDGSSDGTFSLLREKFGDRVRLLRNESAQGVAAARNRAMAECRGQYVAFLDSDDEWLPEKIERQVALAEAGADVVYCRAVNVTPSGEVLGLQAARHRGDVSLKMLSGNVAGSPSAVLVRRSLLEAAGPFRSGIYSEDWDLWLRLAFRGTYDFVPEPMVRIEIERGSRHRSMTPEALVASYRAIYDALENDAAAAPVVTRKRRLCNATIHYYAATQLQAFGRRGKALQALLRSILSWPWQGRAYARLVLILIPPSLESALKSVRAQWYKRAMGVEGRTA